LAAVAIAGLGTAVLWCLGRLLFGLIGGPWDLASCAVGALATGLAVVDPERVSYEANLWPAIGIVFGTLTAISVGHGLEQLLVRRVQLDFEPVAKFLWATIVTSWWLIPLVTFILIALNRAGARWIRAGVTA
jgi:hypothetical protein